MTNLTISQSLIKEVLKQDHCPKQIMYAFLEGRELLEPSENMKLGRYFESELLGSCRGGEKQHAVFLKDISLKPAANAIKGDFITYILQYTTQNDPVRNTVYDMKLSELRDFVKKMPENKILGEKATPYKNCDFSIDFAKDVFEKLGIDISIGQSQVLLSKDGISGNIDHINKDFQKPTRDAVYDVKYTETKEDDRWNGWGDIESKHDAHLQARHYVLTYYKVHGVYPPFYFLVFGKDNWVKVISIKITPESLEKHEQLIAYVARIMKEYAETGFKGNGSFNKCLACPFYHECEDKSLTPETISITV